MPAGPKQHQRTPIRWLNESYVVRAGISVSRVPGTKARLASTLRMILRTVETER